MKTLEEFLEETERKHSHLCPRQVLGVRMGLMAKELLGMDLPQSDKRLLTIMETDGCAVDGISVVTGCTVGHRTLRVEDYGKIAATFIDTQRGRAIRIAPQPGIRERAGEYAPPGCSKWEQHLIGYQRMPLPELLNVMEVELIVPVEKIVSRPGRKAICEDCGEEINNEREVRSGNQVLCRACAGGSYYEPARTMEMAR